MHKEIAFPEFIGETGQAVVLVVPSLDQDLSFLFSRFHEGEEIDYWFSWELTAVKSNEFMVTLEIGWEGEDVVSIGFTPEMWEYLPVFTKRGHVVLMTDWRLIEEGIEAGMDHIGRFRPKALLVRDAGRGMEELSSKVTEQAMSCEDGDKLAQLLEILQNTFAPGAGLH